jgi:hypothetical protein
LCLKIVFTVTTVQDSTSSIKYCLVLSVWSQLLTAKIGEK